jgi:hypothetical protein
VNVSSSGIGRILFVDGGKLLAALYRFTNLLGSPATVLELVLPFYR